MLIFKIAISAAWQELYFIWSQHICGNTCLLSEHMQICDPSLNFKMSNQEGMDGSIMVAVCSVPGGTIADINVSVAAQTGAGLAE